MEQQPTAVNWLAEEFDRIEKEFYKESTEYSDAKARALTLAEFMFKEQIVKSAQDNFHAGQDLANGYKIDWNSAEEYFDKTFNAE